MTLSRNKLFRSLALPVRCRFASEQRAEGRRRDRLCRFSRWLSCELRFVADFALRRIKRKRAPRSFASALLLAFFVGILANISHADPTINQEILDTLKETLYSVTYDGDGNAIYYPVLTGGVESQLTDFLSNTGVTGARGMTATQYLDILQELGIVEMVEDTNYDPPLYRVEINDYDALGGVYTNEYFLTQMSARMSQNTLEELFSNAAFGGGDFTVGAFSLLGFAFPKFLEGIDALKNGLTVSNDYSQILRKMDEIISTLKDCCSNKNQDIQIQILEWMTNNWDRAEFAPPDDGGTNSVNDSTNDFSLGVRMVDLLGGETPAIEWISEYDDDLNLTRRPVWSSPDYQPQEQYLLALTDLQEQVESDSIGFGEVVTSLLQIQSYIQCDILSAHKILYDALFSGTNDIDEVSKLSDLKTQIDEKNSELFQSLGYALQDVTNDGDSNFVSRFKTVFQNAFNNDQYGGEIHLQIGKFLGESGSDVWNITINTNSQGWQKCRSTIRFFCVVMWSCVLWILFRRLLCRTLAFFLHAVNWCLSIFGINWKPLEMAIAILRFGSPD